MSDQTGESVYESARARARAHMCVCVVFVCVRERERGGGGSFCIPRSFITDMHLRQADSVSPACALI